MAPVQNAPPWVEAPTVRLDLAVPPIARFAAVPDALAEQGRALVETIARQLPPSYPLLARLVSLRTGRRFDAEARGLADRVGVDWRLVLVANVTYDLVVASLGCSTAALATPDGPVLARNMDWMPEGPLARASVRIDTIRGEVPVHSQAGWPSGIGVVTGLSARGFAVALNAVAHSSAPDRLGYPVLLHLRRVLDDAADFDDALKRLTATRLASPALITLVGRENRQRAVIERTPRTATVRRPRGDEPLVTTNHYQASPQAGGSAFVGPTAGSVSRCLALNRTLEESATEPMADSRLLFALTEPDVMQAYTAQHVIARPAGGTLRLFVPRRLVMADPD